MRKFGIGSAIALIAFSTAAQAAPASVKGRWITQDKDAVIEISQCGATICGRIKKFLVTPPDGQGQKDIYNPNKNLRKRTLLGLPILTTFKADGTKWRGKIYDPNSGKTYRSIIYKTKSGNLTVKGCIGPFCQSQTWRRAR